VLTIPLQFKLTLDACVVSTYCCVGIRSDEGERIFISEGENGCTLLLSKLENAYLYSRTPGMTGN